MGLITITCWLALNREDQTNQLLVVRKRRVENSLGVDLPCKLCNLKLFVLQTRVFTYLLKAVGNYKAVFK